MSTPPALRTPGSSGRCDSATKLGDSPFIAALDTIGIPGSADMNSSGGVALFCSVLIAVAELRTRRRLEAEAPERLKRFISLAVVLVAGWLRYRQTGARASVGGTQPSRT